MVLLAGSAAMAGSFCGSLNESLVTCMFGPMIGLNVAVVVSVVGLSILGGTERFGVREGSRGGCWAVWEALASVVVGVRRMIVKSRIVTVRLFVQLHVGLAFVGWSRLTLRREPRHWKKAVFSSALAEWCSRLSSLTSQTAASVLGHFSRPVFCLAGRMGESQLGQGAKRTTSGRVG